MRFFGLLTLFVLPAVLFGQSYQVGWQNSMTRVYIDNDVASFSNWGTSGSIAAAKNENESIQIIVRATANLTNVGITSGNLTGPGTIASANVTVEPVGNYYVGGLPFNGNFWYPDPLLPETTVDITSGDYQSFWVTVYVPKGTPAGNYSGTLTISATGQSSTNFTINLEVYNFTLPDVPNLPTVYSHDERRGWRNFNAQNQISSAKRQDMYNTFLDYRAGCLCSIYGQVLRTSDMVAVANSRWNAKYVVAGNAMKAEDIRNNSGNTAVLTSIMNGNITSTQGKLSGLQSNFDFSGDTSRVLVWYCCDEMDDVYASDLQLVLGLWRTAFDGTSSAKPYLPIITTARINTTAEYDTYMSNRYVDIVAHAASGWDKNGHNYVKSNYPGREVWWYTADFPVTPNWMVTANDLSEVRIFMGAVTQAWVDASPGNGPDGWLHWSLNSNSVRNTVPMSLQGGTSKVNWNPYWLSGRSEAYKGAIGSGELVFIYSETPGDTSVIGSIRAAGFRDGLDDFDYYRLLQTAVDDNPGSQYVSQANAALAVHTYLVYNTTNTANFSHNPDNLYTARAEVADLIVALYGGEPPPPANFVTVSSPNGGETWEVGATHNITWTASAGIANVKIELTRNNGSSWETIIASTPNDGTHPWQVTAAATTQAKVRVSNVLDSNVNDQSNSNFTIAASGAKTVTVTRPNGTEAFAVGAVENITWTTTGNITSVKIEISRNAGSTWSDIIASTTNDGVYEWTVTSPTTTTALVRISDVADANVNDQSNIQFAIVGSPTGGTAQKKGLVAFVQVMKGKRPTIAAAADTTELFIYKSHETRMAELIAPYGTITLHRGDTLRTTLYARSGSYSTKFTSDGTSGQHSINWGVDDFAAPTKELNGFVADSTYTISCWVYIPSTDAGTVTLYIWDGTALNGLDTTAVQNQWVQLSGQYTVPTAATQVTVEAHIVGQGGASIELMTNPDHEVNTATLNGAGQARRGTLTKDSGTKYQGSFSSKYVGDNTVGSHGLIYGQNNQLNGFDLNTQYTLRTRVYLPTGLITGTVHLYLWDGAALNSIASTTTKDTWVLLKGTHTMPVSTSEIKLEIHVVGDNDGTFYADSTSAQGPGSGSDSGIFYVDDNSAILNLPQNPTVPEPTGDELFTNGNFESGLATLNGYGEASGGTLTWVKKYGGGAGTSRQSFQGTYSTRFEGNGLAGATRGIIMGANSSLNGFSLSTNYQFDTRVYLPADSCTGTVVMYFWDGTSLNNIASTSTTGSWVVLSGNHTTPSSSAEMKFELHLEGDLDGVFYVDSTRVDGLITYPDHETNMAELNGVVDNRRGTIAHSLGPTMGSGAAPATANQDSGGVLVANGAAVAHEVIFGPTSSMNGFDAGKTYDINAKIFIPSTATNVTSAGLRMEWGASGSPQSQSYPAITTKNALITTSASFTVPATATDYVRVVVYTTPSTAHSDSVYIDDLSAKVTVFTPPSPVDSTLYNPPFPRIADMNFWAVRHAREAYSVFDWVIPRYYRTGTIDTVKKYFPFTAIGFTNDILADDAEGTLKNNFAGNVIPDAWHVRTVNNQKVQLWGGAYLVDVSDYCPTASTPLGTMRANEYIARQYPSEVDTTGHPFMVFDYWTTNAGWGGQVDSVDYDRNGLADNSEAGKSTIAFQRDANLALIREIRQYWNGNPIIAAHEAAQTGSGTTSESEELNGLIDENWRGQSWAWNYNWMDAFAAGNYNPRMNFVEATVRETTDSDPLNDAAKNNYDYMRYGIATACIAGAFYGMDEGSFAHRFILTYDEYLVNLGYPTGERLELGNNPGVYYRKFDNGIAIVNATGGNVTIASTDFPGETYYFFRGNQDVTRNSGGQWSGNLSLTGSGGTGQAQKGDGVLLVNFPGDTNIVDIWVDDQNFNMTGPGQNEATQYGTWTNKSAHTNTKAFAVGLTWDADFHYPFVYTPASAGDSLEYYFTINTTGNYEVFEWHPDDADEGVGTFATNVSYSIWHDGGRTNGTINQTVNFGQANSLGTFKFQAGNPNNRLTIRAAGANGIVVGDGIILKWRGGG